MEHQVVSKEQWLAERRELLAAEKALTAARDVLTARRQRLPWVRLDKDYTFQGASGPCSLEDLFGEHSQLIVYHFMFDPSWNAGCKSCSFVMDHLQQVTAHLAQRDTAFVSVSRAELPTLLRFKERLGWSHRWVSSSGSDFNHDFGVSFTPEAIATGAIDYNYGSTKPFGPEAPGASVFARRGDTIFHTYSLYSRGLEDLMTTYRLLDLVPSGRNEQGLPYGMAWVQLHDTY